MQKSERAAPAYSGCLARIVIMLLVALFIVLNQSHAQTPTKAQQDSIAKEQTEVNKFVDSLLSKTSIKEFRDFLYEKVSMKSFNEGKFAELYDVFLQNKYQEWLQRRKTKSDKPKQ